ncbi:hypothetical protein AOQ84DRAFT_371345 [Glonium stellatum]|uniref:Uncharacterized protein n=1 Tax=Glonium stellatum TaxID=574774 RepID=A0A8E2FC97_9PEZI|nr:hypothetical protein AOQ84DRAFT_371345 [Glonium stellatum]
MDRSEIAPQPIRNPDSGIQQSNQHQPPFIEHSKDDPFSHVRDLPVFPIYAPSDTEKLQKAVNQINRRRGPRYDVHAPLANGSANLSLHMRTTPRLTAILTRYSTPKDCAFPGIVVDVLEMAGNSSWQGNAIRLRTSRECCILVRDKWKIRLKAGSMWSKGANWKRVETISVEVEKDKMFPLGIIGRWQRAAAVEERTEIWRRFEKEYKTPELPEKA